MSTKLGWFGVIGKNARDVIAALEDVARGAPREATPEDGFRVEASGSNTCVMLYGWEYTHVHEWAARVSRVLSAPVLSFLVFDGRWNYSVHDRGEELAAMEANGGEATLRGNMPTAARALGIEADILKRYVQSSIDFLGLDDDEQDRRWRERVFPDDESTVGSDWLHCDLARRAGLAYPENRGTLVKPSLSDPPPKHWRTPSP